MDNKIEVQGDPMAPFVAVTALIAVLALGCWAIGGFWTVVIATAMLLVVVPKSATDQTGQKS